MEQSRKLVLTDWTKANDALNLYFEGNKSKLAKHVNMSRTTVTAFFKPKPVREAEFRKLCLALRLNWQEVSTVEATPARSSAKAPQAENKTDSLQQIRERCRQKILTLHSRMRLLSGEEIGVDQLYVDVWLLNRSPRTFQRSQDKMLETFDLRNDRLGLGDRIKRNPGFEIANANTKLLILGKPGAGKTTFLKHLAVDWCKGQFQPDLIAVFIEFRRVRDGEWHLLDAIGKELELDEGHQIRALKEQIKKLQESEFESQEKKQKGKNQIKEFKQQLEALTLQILLKKGKLLVLMDGLDEVPTASLRYEVQSQLKKIAEQYVNNRWILTCRTQIIEAIPVGFTSVEVADFSPEQVQQFVQNWFQASGQLDAEAEQQWARFEHAVSRNSAVKELTVTPVLLSLMCLVFHDEGEMPSQITDLYKRGIRLLLEKWNDTKALEGWEVGIDAYRKLNVEQKEALLIEIAARKFENPENFVLFQQDEIADHVATLLHLANRNEGVAVLKAMEAQHGLLIERADALWSFSHLTFQEHFTVQWLTQLPLEQLSKKITNRQWQKVIKQLVKSQQPADRLLRLIKQAIDHSIASKAASNSQINKFLIWVLQKAESIQATYKPAAIRALYFILARTSARSLARTSARNLARARALDLVRAFGFDLVRDLDLDLIFDLDLVRARNRDLDLDLAFALALALAHSLTRARNVDSVRNLSHALDHELTVKLQQLGAELPSPETWQYSQQWWQVQGQQWLEQLRQVMREHRNMGHDWQFNAQQKQQLQRYYNANCFLVKLMQIEGAVSYEVRAEIEDSLLLPWDELQRRYPETYSSQFP